MHDRKGFPILPTRFAFLFITLFLISAFLPDAQAWAQASRRSSSDSTSTRSYQIRGAVRSAVNDLAMEMVKVDLKMFTGETVGVTFTRSNGDFEFNGLRNGEYFLDVQHHGFEPLREKVEIMNSSRVGVYVFLKPIGGPAQSSDPAVSARELTIPRKASDAFNRGLEQLIRKNAAEASLRHFDKAISELDTYYEAYHMRGVAFFQMGRVADAQKEFQAAIEKSSNKYAEPYFGLAALLLADKKYAESVEAAKQGLAIDEKGWRGYFEMARAQLGLNQVNDAARSIDQAKQLRPEFADIYLISANINIRRQDAVALLNDFEAYLRVQPEGPTADDVKKRRDMLRSRMAQSKAETPVPEKKPN